jgi:predicted CoA-substrate-specific enzyme activase
VGLDCGSTYSKGVILDQNLNILAKDYIPSGWDFTSTGETLLASLLQKAGLTGSPRIAATGYGRLRLGRTDLVITEISCHARGAQHLRPGVRTVIDIGGQDTKVLTLKDGQVLDFLMNDKCAAGTGRFLEMALGRLGLNWADLASKISFGAGFRLNSVCAVFAESEIMGLLASGRPREEIIGGALTTLADRAAALAARLQPKPPAVLTGGLAGSPLLSRYLSEAMGFEVEPLELGVYAGALGAAWSLLNQKKP